VIVLAAAVAAVALSGLQPAAADPSANGVLAPRTVCRGQMSSIAPAPIQLRAMRCLVNWARIHQGLARLRRSAELDRSSAMRAADIRRCNDFSHTPCGEPFLTVFTASHYLTDAGSVGENLAWGQGPLASARATMIGWLHSPDHRRNLFTAQWRDLGVARAKAATLVGRSDVTIWVTQFGRRPGTSAER
jgi:uncharacterized protein YkwD